MIKVKFVKKAGQFCVTHITFDDKGNRTQKQYWFRTEAEAIAKKDSLL